MKNILRLFYLIVLWLPLQLAAAEAYIVRFEGISEIDTLSLLQSGSQLVASQDNPPNTLAALRRRAEADIQNILQVLQSKAYYGARVKVKINSSTDPIEVSFLIDTGPVYPLADFRILLLEHEDGPCSPIALYNMIKLKHLGIALNQPAYPEDILDAEDAVLERLGNKGYPFAKIIKRDVIADQAKHAVFVTLHISSGPLTYFGPVTIIGQKTIRTRFFEKKLAWCDGDRYNPKRIAETQELLEGTGLFRSVSITPAEEMTPEGTLPITIEVSEAKHRSIGFGLNYMTQFGPGVAMEWEHRNYNGEGQLLSISADIWQKMQQATIRQVTPDFGRPRQDLIWLGEYGYEKTKGFSESFASFSGLLERQLNKRTTISFGGMYKYLRSQHSDNNRSFNLLKAPLQLRWSNANNALDPTQGKSFHLKITPTLQILKPSFAYCINTFTGTWYQALTQDERWVLATKLMLGSIIGASRHEIPPPERFYAGSDNTLRGYHYLTVSPLNEKNDPIGGRSLAIFSLETRFRLNENFGGVFFYDVGNVYGNAFPEFSHKQLQAIGSGIRYYTPIGPLRLDIAFPLNRRPHLDSAFQVYFSIGQAF